MSSRPIDLQVNFSQINHVGKDLASAKSAALHSQVVVGQEIAEESLKSDSQVLKTEKSSDGPDVVKEHPDQKPKQEQSKNQKKSKEDKDSSTDSPNEDLFDDPALGRHIDLSC